MGTRISASESEDTSHINNNSPIDQGMEESSARLENNQHDDAVEMNFNGIEKENNGDETENNDIVMSVEEKVQDPQVGMIFDSIDEVITYYKQYGRQSGFPVIKRSSTNDGDDGNLKYVTISCAREGKSKMGGHENMKCLEKDCRNYIEKVRRLQLGEGDDTAILKYFTNKQAQNSNFFYAIDLDEDCRLRNVFWADARSRAAYEEFGDIVTFDTTYLTNKYDMPFAPFVGVNHHGQSILLGCGLISNENTETFIWLFKSWLACMSGQAPSGIIPDQDKAMKNAIAKVFPKTRHRLCLWHIMKKVPEKLKSYKKYESIRLSLDNIVYDSLTRYEFEERWVEMIAKYGLHNNDWLNSIYEERHHWVPIFVKNNFWAGMSTTQRSESMNAFFDGYVNSKTTLKQFLEQYENALRTKVEKEKHEDSKTFTESFNCATEYDMEKQAQDVYTAFKFREFRTELTCIMYCDRVSLNSDSEIPEYQISERIKIGEKKAMLFSMFGSMNILRKSIVVVTSLSLEAFYAGMRSMF
ncbi:unnamed protein product [Prunus brigantina]